jgi:hypothetical protein
MNWVGGRRGFQPPQNASKINAGFSPGAAFIARFTGGGVNAFPRYENGKTKLPLALVKLLKVLDRHPDLLDKVKVA